MADICLAIILVHGAGAADHADQLKDHYGAARAITDPDEIQNGDLLLCEDDTTGLEWAGINNLLLPDMRMPMVRKIALADALAEIG